MQIVLLLKIKVIILLQIIMTIFGEIKRRIMEG
jgi:hypothetical protein